MFATVRRPFALLVLLALAGCANPVLVPTVQFPGLGNPVSLPGDGNRPTYPSRYRVSHARYGHHRMHARPRPLHAAY